MFEKVNPSHPDKIADRIAGAIVDLAYAENPNARAAVEVLIGHGETVIINETDTPLEHSDVQKVVDRICFPEIRPVTYDQHSQDKHLAENQAAGIRCGDNGIFKGMPLTTEQRKLTHIARQIYSKHPTDGKYILDGDRLIICQSNTSREDLASEYPGAEINPIGDWTGGLWTDTGATNRKLGSDMADSVTGGGLHGKDLSKPDVSVTIYAWLKAQRTGQPVELSCAIGDTEIDGRPYAEIVEIARQYIKAIGGFERFAEWGLQEIDHADEEKENTHAVNPTRAG